MSTAKLYLDTRTTLKDGSHTLKIRITHKGDFYIALKIHLTTEQWIDDKVCNHPNSKTLNPYVRQRFTQIENILLKLAADGVLKNLDNVQLKSEIDKILNPTQVEQETTNYTFYDHYKYFISNKTNGRTIEIYKSTINRLSEYSDVKTLTFDDINLAWLRGFEKHLSLTAPSVNARAIHFRNIRAIFNDAINEDKISLNSYPFRKFKIKRKETVKRSLTPKKLYQIMSTQWKKDGKEDIQEAADIFMLMFYLIGINIIDLVNLKSITDGRIEYERAKTERLYSILLPKEAELIIDKYRGEKNLLSIGDRYTNYRGFTTRINLRLKKIGEAIGEPSLTTYWARHTWATIAAGLDIPKETIAAALGHGGDSVTDVYIDFDRKKIDEANRRVISSIKVKRPLRGLK